MKGRTLRRDREMIDVLSATRLLVLGRESGWLYIRVALDQLDHVRVLLDRHGVRYWVDSMAVSLNGGPAVIVVNLGLHNDADRVQAILDKNTGSQERSYGGGTMIDTTTGDRLIVSTEGDGGPFIDLPLSQVDEVRKRLDRAGIPYSVDSMAISIDGEPPMTVINFSRYVDEDRIQAVLDETL